MDDIHKLAPIPFDIIMISHGKMELTIEAIKTLYAYTNTPFHLIVLDDSTPDMDEGSDLTPEWLAVWRKNHNNMTYIHNDEPYLEGNQIFNVGLQYCKHEFVATIMNSVIVEPEWERVALQFLKEHPRILNEDGTVKEDGVGIVGLKCLTPWDRIETAGIVIDKTGDFGDGLRPIDLYHDHPSHRFSTIYECEAVQWAFAIHRKEAILGNLEEGLFHGFKGVDDIDNCFKVRSKGWKVFYCGYGAGIHKTRATRGSNSMVDINLNKQNIETFFKRWGFWKTYIEYTAPEARAKYDEKKEPDVLDVILLTHNALDNTKRCVTALYQNTQTPFKLTVIDDSTDETPDYFAELATEKGNVNYVRPAEAIKSANQVINIGVKLTQSDPFVFLTNSTFVEPDWLPNAMKLMAEDSKVGVVGFKIVSPTTGKIVDACSDGMDDPGDTHTYVKEVPFVGWASVLLRRGALPKEGLEEDFYIGFRGVEDSDNCIVIKKRGWKILYCGTSTVLHDLGKSEGNSEERLETAENVARFKKKWDIPDDEDDVKVAIMPNRAERRRLAKVGAIHGTN